MSLGCNQLEELQRGYFQSSTRWKAATNGNVRINYRIKAWHRISVIRNDSLHIISPSRNLNKSRKWRKSLMKSNWKVFLPFIRKLGIENKWLAICWLNLHNAKRKKLHHWKMIWLQVLWYEWTSELKRNRKLIFHCAIQLFLSRIQWEKVSFSSPPPQCDCQSFSDSIVKSRKWPEYEFKVTAKAK